MVAVPTHFFKVVLAERASGGAEGDREAALGAFVLPNAPVQPNAPLTAFSVPVESLEEAAGGFIISQCSECPALAATFCTSMLTRVIYKSCVFSVN